jgi:hypothetical protein
MELEVSGHIYQTRKMTPMTQFHVMRRIAPVIFALGESASDELLTQLAGSDLLKALEPVSNILATMPDNEVEYVLNTCLDHVDRKQQTGWAKIQAAGGAMMFSDIELSDMLKLSAAVVQDNLGNFLDALPTGA